MTRSKLTDKSAKNANDTGAVIGAKLRAARLDAGMSVADVTSKLRISRDFIKLIEAGDFVALPSSTYVSGFVRSYASVVGVDATEITGLIKQYFDEQNQIETKPTYKFPINDQRPPRSGAIAASMAVLLVVGGYAGWYWLDRPQTLDDMLLSGEVNSVVTPEMESSMTEGDVLISGNPALDQPSVVPVLGDDIGEADIGGQSVMVEMDSNDVPVADAIFDTGADTGADAGGDIIGLAASGVNADQQSASELIETVTQNDAIQNTDLPLVTDQLADAGTTNGETMDLPTLGAGDLGAGDLGGGNLGAGNLEMSDVAAASAPVQSPLANDVDALVPEREPDRGSAIANQRDPATEITLRAISSSWVEIVRNDGEEVMTKLMRAGDTYLINGTDNLYLSTGNAGGIEFLFNDGTILLVGETGEIVRDLPLVIDSLKSKL